MRTERRKSMNREKVNANCRYCGHNVCCEVLYSIGISLGLGYIQK